MRVSDAIRLQGLEQRLHRLSVRDRQNAGVRRKIQRQIRNLKRRMNSAAPAA